MQQLFKPLALRYPSFIPRYKPCIENLKNRGDVAVKCDSKV